MPFLQVSDGEWQRMVNGHNKMLNAFHGLGPNDWVSFDATTLKFLYSLRNCLFDYLRLVEFMMKMLNLGLNLGGGETSNRKVLNV